MDSGAERGWRVGLRADCRDGPVLSGGADGCGGCWMFCDCLGIVGGVLWDVASVALTVSRAPSQSVRDAEGEKGSQPQAASLECSM